MFGSSFLLRDKPAPMFANSAQVRFRPEHLNISQCSISLAEKENIR